MKITTLAQLMATQFGVAIRAGESLGMRFRFAKQSPDCQPIGGGHSSWSYGKFPDDAPRSVAFGDMETRRLKINDHELTFCRYPCTVHWRITGFDSSDMNSVVVMTELPMDRVVELFLQKKIGYGDLRRILQLRQGR